MAKFKVTETIQSTYRGKVGEPAEMQYVKAGDALDVMHAVAQILQMQADSEKESKRFPHLKTKLLAINITLVEEN
jgi:hypothetical protein